VNKWGVQGSKLRHGMDLCINIANPRPFAKKLKQKEVNICKSFICKTAKKLTTSLLKKE